MAAIGSARRNVRTVDIWPGFVDALATLIMVIVFVLMIFTVFQFHLKDIISGRDQALLRLSQQIGELSDLLALERRASADLRLEIAQFSAELQSSTSLRDRLAQELAAARAEADSNKQQAARSDADLRDAFARITSDREKLEEAYKRITEDRGKLEDAFKSIRADRETIEVQLRELDALRRNIQTLTILRQELEAKLAEQMKEVQKGGEALSEERKLSADAQLRADLLTRQLNALREQITRLNALLEASEVKTRESQAQVADLGRRLNLALASKVEELARYRSEFFGRLREVLGDRADIRVVGDRFVFQSEVLFGSGSADLEPEGRIQLERLADALRAIAPRIPTDLNWVLQIDGHTDRRPIATAQFPSNWELSSARAISVVKFLASRSIPAERLSAAGFGEFQPLDARDDEIAFRRNRRIEIKLTSR
ncbi:MAG: peptidoglycan -binding protein [Proteobacteria bacterium]|nr:peptidoglycan -binding protein [Pseudomonadota bacterium]